MKMLRVTVDRPRSLACLDRAARLAAQADAVLEFAATPSRPQLSAARDYYLEALRTLDAAEWNAARQASSRQLSRRVVQLIARERRAIFFEQLRRRWPWLVRVALCSCAIVGLALGGAALWHRAHPDLLRDRPFETSSEFARCEPKKRRCAGAATAIFFHTNEEAEPFIVYDLGQVKSPRRIEVTNRRDNNLAMRAVPLILQASLDGVTWRELARREYWFDVWRADFPATRARYLKLSVGRRSMLHLERVQAWE